MRSGKVRSNKAKNNKVKNNKVRSNKGRVISGEFKGRIIGTPSDMTIRPTTDYIKESIFNVLENEICFSEVNVLDVCAGSGALGIEALSRGASEGIFVDSSKVAVNCIKENIEMLEINDRSIIVCCDARSIDNKIKRFFKEEKRLLVFADPPYSNTTLLQSIIDRIMRMDKVQMFVIESEVSFEMRPILDALHGQVTSKIHGRSKVSFLKMEQI
jgi:16S rRNA (guanine(966)-N(2))-methyltransferase RsmD